MNIDTDADVNADASKIGVDKTGICEKWTQWRRHNDKPPYEHRISHNAIFHFIARLARLEAAIKECGYIKPYCREHARYILHICPGMPTA